MTNIQLQARLAKLPDDALILHHEDENDWISEVTATHIKETEIDQLRSELRRPRFPTPPPGAIRRKAIFL